MSKTKDWLMTLEEDAACMTKADFLKKKGVNFFTNKKFIQQLA